MKQRSMSIFFNEVKQLPGKHRTNVYALLILKLSNYSPTLPDDISIIKSLLSEIKTCFHNHEQQFSILIFFLKQNLGQYKEISPDLLAFLNDVLMSLNNKAFNDYFTKSKVLHRDLECRIQRVFESHIAIKLLENPSIHTWTSVNAISHVIVKFLEENKTHKNLIPFLKNLGPDEIYEEYPKLPLAFRRFLKTPSVDNVIAALKTTSDLGRTMLIHFMFMRDAYYLCETSYPKHLSEYSGDFARYLENKPSQENPMLFFEDYVNQAPQLYKDRGRAEFDIIDSNHLGITITKEDRETFPSVNTTWFPDCLCQQADRSSPYVSSLLMKDIPYVAGPSGMTSVLCAAMAFLGEWENIEEQHYYVLAIVAFITGGGLHSIHEVLTVPHARLGLLPEYHSKNSSNMANYQAFFALFSRDEVITNNIRDAWKATTKWMSQTYPHLKTIQLSKPLEEKDDKETFTKSKSSCLIS